MGLLAALQGRTTYLDTNVFIYALEGFPQFEAELVALSAAVDKGEITCVTSELTLAELLVKPFREGDAAKEAACRQAIRSRPGLIVLPVSLEILVEAARRRATENIPLPDAIHLATAHAGRCHLFLTNDRHLVARGELEVLYLADFSPSGA